MIISLTPRIARKKENKLKRNVELLKSNKYSLFRGEFDICSYLNANCRVFFCLALIGYVKNLFW